jgi:hypothetical protein
MSLRCAFLSSPFRASLLCRPTQIVRPIADLLRLNRPACAPHRPIWASSVRMDAPAPSAAASEAAAAAVHGAEGAAPSDAQKGQKRKADGQEQQPRQQQQKKQQDPKKTRVRNAWKGVELDERRMQLTLDGGAA